MAGTVAEGDVTEAIRQAMVTFEDLLFVIGAVLMGQFLTWLLRLFD